MNCRYLQRNTNFELLRMIAVSIVLFSHLYDCGAIFTGISVNAKLTDVEFFTKFFAIGEIGVVAFVLITGYFLVEQKFRLRSILRFSLQVWVIGIFMLLLNYIFGFAEISDRIFWKTVLPFRSTWWFASAYFCLYWLFPFINILFKKFSLKYLTYFLSLFTFFWIIVPTIRLQALDIGVNVGKVSVVYYYFLGAYIKVANIKLKNSVCWCMFLGGYIACCIGLISVVGLRSQYSFLYGKEMFLFTLESLPIAISGTGLFLLLKNYESIRYRWINLFASTTFGIYLITNSVFVKVWLQEKVYTICEMMNIWQILLFAIIFMVLVIVVCMAIDFLRQKYIEQPIFTMYDRYVARYGEMFDNYFVCVIGKI